MDYLTCGRLTPRDVSAIVLGPRLLPASHSERARYDDQWLPASPSRWPPCRLEASPRQRASIVSKKKYQIWCTLVIQQRATYQLLLDRPQFLLGSSLVHRWAATRELAFEETRKQDSTYHSSEDSESVNVGVGRRFRFFELLSSMDAMASLSARRLILLLCDDEEAKAIGGGEAESFK